MQYHLGVAYQKVGKPDLAKTHLEIGLKLDPKSTDAESARKALQQMGRG